MLNCTEAHALLVLYQAMLRTAQDNDWDALDRLQHPFLRKIELAQGADRLVGHDDAGLGQRDAARMAAEDRRADHLLQLGEKPRGGGLRHAHLLRRRVDLPRLAQYREKTQVRELQPFSDKHMLAVPGIGLGHDMTALLSWCRASCSG